MLALLMWVAGSAIAQRTVVQDAGGGRKLELVYNSSGQATEQRMLGPDGKVTERTEYEHRPGFYQPQETVTTYWPNDKIKTVVHTSYDANSNFLLEFAQVFDESGQHIGGHRLTHDPETNVYHCYEWNMAMKDYREQPCPAGEEGGGGEGPEEAKKYSYDEVMRYLDAARKAALQEQKMRSRRPMNPDPVHPAIVNKEVGLVLPAQISHGNQFSGSIVSHPERYDEVVGIKVFRFRLPFTAAGTGSALGDWEVVMSGRGAQRADGPLAFGVATGSWQLRLMLQQAGSPATAVLRVLDLAALKSKLRIPRRFEAAPLCMKQQLCAVSGPFGGDSSKIFAAMDDRPAVVVAESNSMAYLTVPTGIGPGDHGLLLAEGNKVVAFPVVVGDLLLEPSRSFTQGQVLAQNIRLQGPAELPETEWRLENFPVGSSAQARKLVPGFTLQRQSHEAQEPRKAGQKREAKEKGKPVQEEGEATGQVLLVIRNPVPEQVTLRNSRDGGYVFRLGKPSFARGDFSYDFVVEAKRAGSFGVEGYVIPFLAPVTGQEFARQAPGNN